MTCSLSDIPWAPIHASHSSIEMLIHTAVDMICDSAPNESGKTQRKMSLNNFVGFYVYTPINCCRVTPFDDIVCFSQIANRIGNLKFSWKTESQKMQKHESIIKVKQHQQMCFWFYRFLSDFYNIFYKVKLWTTNISPSHQKMTNLSVYIESEKSGFITLL